MLQTAKNFVRDSFRFVGLDVKRREAPLSTLETYLRIYGEDAVKHRRFYNFGAGGFRHAAWTNVDNPSDNYRHNFVDNRHLIAHDLDSRKPLPIESNSAHLAYTSHCIEHLRDDSVRRFFEEAHRILGDGGIFRVTAPDIELCYRAYRRGDNDFFYWFAPHYDDPDAARKEGISLPTNGASAAQIFLFAFASSMSELHADGAPQRLSDRALERVFDELGFEGALDDICAKCPPSVQQKYPWNHVSWWTKDKTIRFLREAGFEEVAVSAYGQSLAAPLRDTNYFDATQPRVSFYVEAVKRA
ncbi:MAG: methyltransferase domain-containing protein [Labilithrix sp.]|nr:methyltransferase domain-containing protein [Labilithrix sp.]